MGGDAAVDAGIEGRRSRQSAALACARRGNRTKSTRVSPTIFRHGKYRGFFFSREEPRMHVHVESPDGEAEFWIEPILALASHSGLPARELARMQEAVE
jgi:hypothetical protein